MSYAKSVAVDLENIFGVRTEVVNNWIGFAVGLPEGNLEVNIYVEIDSESTQSLQIWLRFCDGESSRIKLSIPLLKGIILCGAMQHALKWGTLLAEDTPDGVEIALFRQVQITPPPDEEISACVESVTGTLDRLVREWSVLNLLFNQRQSFPLDQLDSLVHLLEFALEPLPTESTLQYH